MSCDNKSMCDPGKISYRKDKFTQHFANTHPEVNCASYYDNNHFVVTSRFARRCGFCTTYWFGNWQDRINHIGDHFSVDRYDMTQWQVLDNEEEDEEGDEVDDEEDDDDRGPDEDDKGFDEDQNDRADGPGKDFDWHNHDYNDDALSDSSEDDSDDSPPCPVPKQLAQTEHHDALATSNPEESLFGNQNDIFANQTRRTIFDGASSEEAMFVDQGLPQDSEHREFGNNHTLISNCSHHVTRHLQTRFTRIRVLGIGPYSVVDEVKDWATRCTLARKTVHYTTQRTFKALKAEVEIMKKLKHPHIVQFVGAYTADHSLSILMTPSADFDLDYLIGSYSGPVNTRNVVQWFSCLISGVDYLHSHSIKHQDIKPSNILIRGNTIFLADFGVAKTFNDFESTTSTSGHMTRKYCSPETALDGYRGRKSDIFSLGCVFLEMLSFLLQDDGTSFYDYQQKNFTGDGVYHQNLSEIREWLHCLRRTENTRASSLDLNEVIEACEKMLKMDPRDRPSAGELTVQFAPGECCEVPLCFSQKLKISRPAIAIAQHFDECSSTEKYHEDPLSTKLLRLQLDMPLTRLARITTSAPLHSSSYQILKGIKRRIERSKDIEKVKRQANKTHVERQRPTSDLLDIKKSPDISTAATRFFYRTITSL